MNNWCHSFISLYLNTIGLSLLKQNTIAPVASRPGCHVLHNNRSPSCETIAEQTPPSVAPFLPNHVLLLLDYYERDTLHSSSPADHDSLTCKLLQWCSGERRETLSNQKTNEIQSVTFGVRVSSWQIIFFPCFSLWGVSVRICANQTPNRRCEYLYCKWPTRFS